MPDFKAYLRNFSKTLGIMKPLEESVEYNETQAVVDVVAPFDGYMSFSINCTYYWINTTTQPGDASVLAESSGSLSFKGATIPIKKGHTYHISTDWESERYEVVLFPLMNTN